jgi:acetoin utilization deacetylase AcuC-like enzyme
MTTAVSMVLSPNHFMEGHEEAPERFKYLGGWESKPYSKSISFLHPQPASFESVTAVHSTRMLQAFKEACAQGPGITDYAPTYVTPGTYQDAFLAAGAALACTRAVLSGEARSAFAILRPPGHHAEPEAAMGFCLLNNVAIATRHALRSGLDRVLIVDFDAHHGNGTQAAFIDELRVAFLSTQQQGIYPYHTGFATDAPHARGRIVNLPLPPRSGDRAFEQIAEQVLSPLADQFVPEMIFVSAGFDSHWDDPLAELGLSSTGYLAYARRLVELADRFCSGRIVFCLEGGYNPRNIASGVDAVLAALTGTNFDSRDPSPYPEPEIKDLLAEVRAWNNLQ